MTGECTERERERERPIRREGGQDVRGRLDGIGRLNGRGRIDR